MQCSCLGAVRIEHLLRCLRMQGRCWARMTHEWAATDGGELGGRQV